ncbi:MAG TPA: gluconokinase [bacterium]
MRDAPRATERLGDVVLALDIGTSSTRVLAFTVAGVQVPHVAAAREYQARATLDGGSELDMAALEAHALDCLASAAAAVQQAHGKVLAVGVCTFWHAFVGVDGSGRAVTPIYLWNDNRSGDQAIQLRRQLDEAAVHGRTGCYLHPSYLAPRLLWLQQRDPAAYRRCAQFLSPGEYLERAWFGVERCSVSMASGTGLLNQQTLRWDEEMLAAVGLVPAHLHTIVAGHTPVHGLRGPAADRVPALRDVPFFPALGDGACSNVGSGAKRTDQAAVMIGTSAAMRVLLPGDARPAPAGLWRYLLDPDHVLVGGALSNGGNLYAWLRDTLRVGSEAEIERWLANAQPGAHGLAVLPFLAGERNPDYPLHATGMIAGLRLATSPLDLLQAGMEAVAFRLAAIADRLHAAGPGVQSYLASGGLLKSPAWVRMITDVLGLPLTISAVPEASARGAALMALQGVGAIPSALEVEVPVAETLHPDPRRQGAYARAREQHTRLYGLWKADNDASAHEP